MTHYYKPFYGFVWPLAILIWRGKKSTHNGLPLGSNVGLQGQDDAPRSTVVDVQRATMPSKPMQMQEKYF